MKHTGLASAGIAAAVALFLAAPASAQKVAGGGDGGGSKSAPAPAAAPAPSAPSGGSTSSGSSGGNSGGGYSGGGYRGGRDSDGGGRRDGSTGSTGYSAPRGGSSGSKGDSSSSGASGKGSSSGANGGYTGGAVVGTAAERGGGRKPFGEGTPKTTTGDGVPTYSRPRGDGEPVGTAVPRGTTPRPPTGTTGIFIPGGYYGGYGYYDPWGYYGGSGYYGGYYDPWYGGYPTYPVGSSTSSNDDEGSLRLKIKPREAEVYVDGYFVGVVDDFDGIFQRLHLDSGPHRIEVRAPGYETLDFEVRITPDHTTTYQGDLKKIQ